MSKKYRLAVVCVTALTLVACDDGPTITHVNATTKLDKSRIATTAAGGFPTEVHGAPFPGIEPFQVAEVLKMPQGWPGGVAFRAVEPGSHDYHSPIRLVLVFNGGNPDHNYHCKLKEPLKTAPPSGTGFDVNAVFCSGEEYFATGYMKAPKVTGEDATGYRKAMRQLLRVILDQIDQNKD